MTLLQEYVGNNQSYFLAEGSYVREVLGIQVPLNESYPYAPELQSRIIYEQMMLEGFWDDLKSMKDTTKNLFAAFKKVSTSPETVKSLTNHFSKATRHARKQLFTLLNTMIEKLGDYNMPTFKSWAEKIKAGLVKILEAPDKVDGWKAAIAQAGVGLTLKYLWDQIGSIVEAVNKGLKEFLKKAAEGLSGGALEEAVEKLKEFLKEKVLGGISPVIKEKMQQVASKLLAQFSGVGAWFDAAKTAFDGASFVLDFLKTPLSKFMTVLKAETLVRDYVRGILLEKSYGAAKDQRRMIKVNDMRIRIDIDDIDYRATKHSQERQSRHKDVKGRGFGISSKSIDRAIDAAIGDIINDYANGELRNGERFLIVAKTGPGVPLNIVGALNMRKGPDDFGVITVMRKEGFMSELPTYEVKV